jgi:hypothetical protein
MPAFPHLTTADVDALVAYLIAVPGGRGMVRAERRAWRSSQERAGIDCGSGSVWTRPDATGGRGARPATISRGCPQFERPVISDYNTVGSRITPPYTSILSTT